MNGPETLGGGPRGRVWYARSPMWGFVQPAVLLLLAEGPKHGYAILEELRGRGYLPGKADVGNLYRGLRRMEAEGYVTSTWAHSGSGPPRRSYLLTDKGELLLHRSALALARRAGYIERLLTEYSRLFPEGPPEEAGNDGEG